MTSSLSPNPAEGDPAYRRGMSPALSLLMPPEGIPLSKRGAVGAYIKARHPRAKRWTATPDDLAALAAYGDKYLSAQGLRREEFDGAIIDATTAGPRNARYRHYVECSRIELAHIAGEWRLMYIIGSYRLPPAPPLRSVMMSPDQGKIAAQRWAYWKTGERPDDD